MTYFRNFLSITACAIFACGAAAAQSGFPWTNESLRYTMNWQSGLSVGDATLSAHKGEDGWGFEATVNAGVPGFAVNDRIRSTSTQSLCSTSLDREFSHARKKTREKTTFDQKLHSAERLTLLPDGGSKPGRSTFDIPICGRDALTFLYYARAELGQGRMAPEQKVFFGSAYNVKIEYTGAQDIMVAKKSTTTDHMMVTVRGPKSDFHFEVFFARDAARTPLEIKVPLSMGTFTLDLVR
ncbi:MAG TPA: DUF3108 domain-containing protein [Candidatus Sulfopaludibacter sp.]|jgi:hypothetical protein|nr:DUF3108 domain-containing protein [Candidatus Sulfopaludibacter sp.]